MKKRPKGQTKDANEMIIDTNKTYDKVIKVIKINKKESIPSDYLCADYKKQ